MTTYEQTCNWAATDQGLDPISARLSAERIAHTVEQAGGYVMSIRIPLREPAWIGVNAGEARSGRWHLVLYADDEGDEGLDITDQGLVDWTSEDYAYEWPPDEAVAAIRLHLDESSRANLAIQTRLERIQRPAPERHIEPPAL